MREIKFRGKRIDNGEWVYGYLCMTKWTSCTPVENKGTWHEPKYEATEEYAHQVKCLEINKGRWWFAAIQQTKNLNSILEVDPKTVGQYTGLKDKKGKEIYEGDIVYARCCEKYLEVYWNDIGCGGWWFAEKIDGDMYPVGKIDLDWLEVKGNIHDNPELLEGEEGE